MFALIATVVMAVALGGFMAAIVITTITSKTGD
jgi:hypothetical protein